MSIYTLEIPGFHPTPLNKLLGHWAAAGRLKAHDRDIIGTAVLAYRVQPATGKRRVSIRLVLPKGRRAVDPDALWKSTLDSLVHARALVDDNRNGCELGAVKFCRGDELVTYLTLEDVA